MAPEAQTRIALVVNGERQTFGAPLTVAGLLAQSAPRMPRVAVLVNGEVIRGEDHTSTALGDGDAVEVISMVGGG